MFSARPLFQLKAQCSAVQDSIFSARPNYQCKAQCSSPGPMSRARRSVQRKSQCSVKGPMFRARPSIQPKTQCSVLGRPKVQHKAQCSRQGTVFSARPIVQRKPNVQRKVHPIFSAMSNVQAGSHTADQDFQNVTDSYFQMIVFPMTFSIALSFTAVMSAITILTASCVLVLTQSGS